jgi:hypothetical protein
VGILSSQINPNEALEALLYPSAVRPANRKPVLPDWQMLHDELVSHKHLTLMLLLNVCTRIVKSGDK